MKDPQRIAEALYDRTARMARVGGWGLDLRTGEQIWSDEVCRIFGVPPGYRPTQAQSRQFLAPDTLQMMEALIHEGMAQGKPWDVEMPIITAQNKRLWVRSIGEVVFEDGKPIGLVGATQDITEQIEHRAELAREQSLRRQLEQRAAELNALLTERSDMLVVLAHEVRQPLHNASAALQSAQAALANVDEKVATPRLARAQSVLTQVMAGLDNTLAAAALLAHGTPIGMGDADVDTLVAVAIGDMAQADRSRIVVRRHTHVRTALMDMSLMRLALRNLLSNALKYGNPSAPVVVSLADSEEPLGLLIDVSDTGPEIGAALLPTLFQRSVRDRHHHGAPVGMGLGLYIVRRVMELHGGRAELACNGPETVTMRLLLPAST